MATGCVCLPRDWSEGDSPGRKRRVERFRSHRRNSRCCSKGSTGDDLGRIASANCGSPWSQTFSYDVFGNLSKSGTQSFQPTYSYLTNQMTQIGSSTPTYDANGNVTNDFLHTYAWDAAGRPVTIDGVGVTYDALGRMAEQDNSGTYSQLVYAPSGAKLAIMSGQTLQKAFVPLTGGSLAVYNSSGLAFYRHSDWIGSSRFASTPSRGLYYDGAYGPFGEPYAQSGTTDVSFTGMDQDTVSNLYDFPAREYGIQGRWPSPDPAGISSVRMNDPQTWNRYSYVRNNPLKLTDPTGMIDCDMWTGCVNGTGGGWGGGSGGFSVTTSDGSSGGANPSGVCVYLNNAGTGVDQQYGNGIDMNSNSGECAMNGGYFFPGYANPATIDIDSDGGLDPMTESAVTVNGVWNGSLYNLTMFAPGALGTFGPTPSQLFTQDQCNQMNQGLNRLNLLGGFGIAVTSMPFVGGWNGVLLGGAVSLSTTVTGSYVNQMLCGGPSF